MGRLHSGLVSCNPPPYYPDTEAEGEQTESMANG